MLFRSILVYIQKPQVHLQVIDGQGQLRSSATCEDNGHGWLKLEVIVDPTEAMINVRELRANVALPKRARLLGPVLWGALPSDWRPLVEPQESFQGCLAHLEINEMPQDLWNQTTVSTVNIKPCITACP